MSPSAAINTIIYATDLGEQMRPVFHRAIDLAERYSANIIMVHVMEPLNATGNALMESYLLREQLKQLHQEGMQSILEQMRDKASKFCQEEIGACPATGSTLVSEIVVTEGIPSLVIPEQAVDKGADLIVMGTCAHQLMGRGLLGSTAQRVIQRSPVEVMVVPNCDR